MAMRPFKLTAHMLRGVCAEAYTPDLAGLLASKMWRRNEHSPRIDSNVERPDDLDLPLEMCAAGDDWHWLAVGPVVEVDELHPQEPRTYYRVVNDSWASRAAHRPLPYIHPRSSAYRDVMMPAHITLTPTLTWYGVGDPLAVLDLVQNIRFVGKRRAKGEGKVLRWEMDEMPAADQWRFGHLGPGDRIIRPIPVECADKLKLDYELVQHAIRPPAWNPNRLRALAVEPEEEMYLPQEWEL